MCTAYVHMYHSYHLSFTEFSTIWNFFTCLGIYSHVTLYRQTQAQHVWHLENWSSTSIPRSEISLSKDAPCGQVSEVGSSLFCQHQHRNLLSLCSSVIILFLYFQDQRTREKQRWKDLFWLMDSEGSVHHGEVKQMNNLSPIMTDQGIKRRECYYCDGTTLSSPPFFFPSLLQQPTGGTTCVQVLSPLSVLWKCLHKNTRVENVIQSIKTKNHQNKVYTRLLHCTFSLAHTLSVSEVANHCYFKKWNSFTIMQVYNHLNI